MSFWWENEEDVQAEEEWRTEVATRLANNHTPEQLHKMMTILSPNGGKLIFEYAIRIASERVMQSALSYTEACEADPSLWPPIPQVEMGRGLER